jgi:PhzF family phenazine biosynthesis protein
LQADALAALHWAPDELDPALPPAVGYAGAHHLIIAAGSYERLRQLSYDFDRLRSIMRTADLTTVQLVWRESASHFRARDPFPVGDVVEDPATGAAAAALGAYLRWRAELIPPARFTISQGVEMGRPSHIEVEVPDTDGGIRVSGTAVSLGADA